MPSLPGILRIPIKASLDAPPQAEPFADSTLLHVLPLSKRCTELEGPLPYIRACRDRRRSDHIVTGSFTRALKTCPIANCCSEWS